MGEYQKISVVFLGKYILLIPWGLSVWGAIDPSSIAILWVKPARKPWLIVRHNFELDAKNNCARYLVELEVVMAIQEI